MQTLDCRSTEVFFPLRLVRQKKNKIKTRKKQIFYLGKRWIDQGYGRIGYGTS